MASDIIKCVFCSKEDGKKIAFVEKRLNNCKNVLSRRIKFKLKYNNVRLPDNANTSDGYHRKCYSYFTALKARYRNLSDSDSSSTTDLPSTSNPLILNSPINDHETTFDDVDDDNNFSMDIDSNTEETDLTLEPEDVSTTKTSVTLKNICFFCQKKRKLVKRKHQNIHSSNHANIYEKVIRWMRELQNDELLEKICNLKSSGGTVFYHRLCALMYGNNYKKKVADAPRTSWHATRDIHKSIFGNIILLIEEEVVKNKNCLLLSSLCDLYNKDVERELQLQSQPDLSLIRKYCLEKKILQHFKTTIKISRKHGKKYIMHKNCSLLEDDDRKSLYLIDKAAFTVRNIILNIGKSTLPSKNKTNDLNNGSVYYTRKESLRESRRIANSSRQGSDKEENLTLLSLLVDSKQEQEDCSLLPEEVSESGAEVLSSGSDPFDVERTELPQTSCFSPSGSAEVYNTAVPSCLSSSDNWPRENETEMEAFNCSNPPPLPGVINDACSKFFQSMADTVRDLPPDLQIEAKRNVLHAVTECELTALKRVNEPKN